MNDDQRSDHQAIIADRNRIRKDAGLPLFEY
jgi:hypothetical protein